MQTCDITEENMIGSFEENYLELVLFGACNSKELTGKAGLTAENN